jgi:hypothetical protein
MPVKQVDPDEQEYQDYKDYSDYQEYVKNSSKPMNLSAPQPVTNLSGGPSTITKQTMVSPGSKEDLIAKAQSMAIPSSSPEEQSAITRNLIPAVTDTGIGGIKQLLGLGSIAEEKQKTQQLAQKYPNAAGLGNVLGSVGAAALPMGATAGIMGKVLPLAAGPIGTILGDVATGAAQGMAGETSSKVLQKGELPSTGQLAGSATIGGALPLAMQGAGAVKNLGSYFSRKAAKFSAPEAEAYANNPEKVHDIVNKGIGSPEVQDEAASALNQAQEELKKQGLKFLEPQKQLALQNKKSVINTDNLMGLGADDILADVYNKNTRMPGADRVNPEEVTGVLDQQAQELPSGYMEVDASDAYKLKQRLQENANFKGGSTTREAHAADNEISKKASIAQNEIKAALPADVNDIASRQSELMRLQDELYDAQKSAPLAKLMSGSPDVEARLLRAERSSGVPLSELSNQLGAAKATEKAGEGLMGGITAGAGRAGLRLLGPAKKVQSVNPQSLQAILQGLKQSSESGQ